MYTLKVRRVGNSLGFTLPAAAARALGVGEGDRLHLTATPDGFRLTAHDPTFEQGLEAAESFMAQYRNALRALGR